ncbi:MULTISPECIES: polysaccharide biosynthesis tyrosine autokinase [unclassified Cobetia]|uniref:polysaccharide biosynthesis tyrosine autokinase n=1 Tax=unclassified Cobetia TaxID=2609414 RepID=UPI002098463D|nr:MULTISPECIES: polysaccharide biosynthesis tyrosine autokinase [unclassified Cobetia]MCO7234134.1 polysaccharide biosynthesis tyrosine autokinase [Cobetia sp. Dlab-2-AX]MCO7237411.1 polysaccharide biosynthesis tyrosine autokinase [Cobetia sp. Dlab-2-U]
MNQTPQNTATGAMSSAATRDNDDDAIDLGRLFGILVDHKQWIIAITGLFAVIGVVYALLATPIYKVDALIQIDDAPSTNPLADVNSILGKEPPSQSEIEIIRSRMVLGRAVDLLNLDIIVTPKRLPLLGDFLVRRGVERQDFAQGWASTWAGESISVSEMPVDDAMLGNTVTLRVLDESHYELIQDGELLGKGRINQLDSFADGQLNLRVTALNASAGAEFELTHISRMQAIEDLRKSFSVSEQGKETGILSWSMTGEKPRELQRTLNTIADIYYSQNVQRQSEEARNSLEFLDNQVPKVRAQLDAAESRLNEFRTSRDSVDLSLETQSVLERIVNLEAQVNQLELTEAEIAKRYTPSHPTYKALLEKKAQLKREMDKLNAQVKNLPETQQEVLRLTRSVEVTQAIYVQLLNKVQEMEIAKASTVGNVRILDDAGILPGAIKPKKAMLVVIATLLGGMLSVGVILLRAAFRRGVESPDQLEALGLPMYATIPLSDEQGKLSRKVKRKTDKHSREIPNGLLAARNPADLAIEALRGLRTSLHFAMMEAPTNTLMITGPSPGIGKSFVAANLAAVCAQAGQRVLVVDADMRKGHMHSIFDERSECGLSDYLAGKKSLEDVIRTVSALETLSYVARGIAPPNPSELLMSTRFREFMAAVSERFDLIIIDSPPILAVTDAAVIGKHVGTTLLVTRFEVNAPKEVEVSLKRLAASGVTVKGGILNAMERKAAGTYGENYGYYNYSYK